LQLIERIKGLIQFRNGPIEFSGCAVESNLDFPPQQWLCTLRMWCPAEPSPRLLQVVTVPRRKRSSFQAQDIYVVVALAGRQLSESSQATFQTLSGEIGIGGQLKQEQITVKTRWMYLRRD
jgi:hypothetical protein